MSAVSLLSSNWRPIAVHLIHVWAVYALIGAQAPDEASLARIKSALQKPAPTLIIAVPKADFRVNIDAIRPFADLFELPPWVTPPSDLAAPPVSCSRPCVTQLVSADPGVIGHAISKAIRTRRAHAEVIRAIVEYCAAHHDEPGAAGICGGPPR
jgi:hypothetical protein